MRIAAALVVLLAGVASARAEQELSFYTGAQGVAGSDVSGEDAGRTGFDFSAEWQGVSFEGAPYYGLRYVNWRGDRWGVYADFTHVKAAAVVDTLADTGFGRLEFTDGVNVLTLGATRRFGQVGGFTPYLGAGLGVAIPHVEVQMPGQAGRTYEYQIGGPAAELRAGASYRFNPRLSAFAEVEANYVALDVDLDGGGSLETDLVTGALNLGLTYSFGRR